MNLDKESSQFLHHYQNLLFSEQLKCGTPSNKADILRNLIGQLQLANLQGRLTDEGYDVLCKEYKDSYVSVVDSHSEESGLNNFAEGALSICSKHRNESQKWKSSLSVEKVKQMECYKKYEMKYKKKYEKLFPPDKQSVPLISSFENNKVIANKEEIHVCPASSLSKDVSLRGFSDVTNKKMNNFPSTSVAKDMGGRKPLFSAGTTTENRQFGNMGQPFKSVGKQYSDNPQQFSNNGQYSRNNGHSFGNTDQFSNVRSQFGEAQEDSRWSHNGSSWNQVGSRGPHNFEQNRVGGLKRPFTESDDDVNAGQQNSSTTVNAFRTAKEQLSIENQKKYGRARTQVSTFSYGANKKSLGTSRRGLSSKFVPPVMSNNVGINAVTKAVLGKGGEKAEEVTDERLKGIEPKMIELIMNEIMDHGPQMSWDDIAGLEFAKKTIKEIVVWPMLRPDIFTGLRGPPKGLLLFGPPGTGKTLIGKCIASQSKSTFFSISASSLTSKWVGEGEKMVRAMFTVARCHQPAVVFIDEIDSLLSQRSDGEHEASRRIKTEFLVQLDGAATVSDDRILVIGATNRPQEIDEAARRRFVKRLYIPLPEGQARTQIVLNLLSQQKFQLSQEELNIIQQKSDGYSGSDVSNLCKEAALGPIRSMPFSDIENITADQVRPIMFEDFEDAFHQVRASVSEKDLDLYLEWDRMYGSASNRK